MRKPAFNRESVIVAAGILLGVSGVLISVVGVSPDEWLVKTSSWLEVLKNNALEVWENKWKTMFFSVVTFCAGFIFIKSEPSSVLGPYEFEKKFQEIFKNNDIRSLLVFGYTQETLRDYQKFEHLYLKDLEIKILNRSWVAEKADEEVHNRKIEHLDIRPWKKAEEIQKNMQAPWKYPAKRQIRYYDFCHPIVKGTILKSGKSTWAFVNFYEWQEIPRDGGSQFKGADMGMVFFDGSKPHERLKIQALESQFNLIWKYRSREADAVNTAYTPYL